MASTSIIYYSIDSPSFGSAWSGTINWTDNIETTSTQVSSGTLPNSIEVTIDSVTTSFTPSKFLSFAGNYITWRSKNSNDQFPESWDGYSLDIWSDDLYTDVITNGQNWDDLIGNGAYNLSTNKNTLYYAYSELRPIVFSVGGTITFSLTSP